MATQGILVGYTVALVSVGLHIAGATRPISPSDLPYPASPSFLML